MFCRMRPASNSTKPVLAGRRTAGAPLCNRLSLESAAGEGGRAEVGYKAAVATPNLGSRAANWARRGADPVLAQGFGREPTATRPGCAEWPQALPVPQFAGLRPSSTRAGFWTAQPVAGWEAGTGLFSRLSGTDLVQFRVRPAS